MPREMDSCVRQVKAKGKVNNPYAVCRASLGTDRQILARRKKSKGLINSATREARSDGNRQSD